MLTMAFIIGHSELFFHNQTYFMKRLFKLLIVPLIIFICICITDIVQSERRVRSRISRVSRTVMEYKGIDISHHNKITDWSALPVDFIYIKATEGASWTDPEFLRNLEQAKIHKIPVGAYHFLTTSSSAEDQFEHFKKVVPRDKITLIPMLDIEKQSKGHVKSANHLQRHVREWVTLCEEYYGRKPIIYSSIGFYMKYLQDKFDDCHFWTGDVGAPKSYLKLVDWTIWQHEIGPLRGVGGKVDKNILRSSYGLGIISL